MSDIDNGTNKNRTFSSPLSTLQQSLMEIAELKTLIEQKAKVDNNTSTSSTLLSSQEEQDTNLHDHLKDKSKTITKQPVSSKKPTSQKYKLIPTLSPLSSSSMSTDEKNKAKKQQQQQSTENKITTTTTTDLITNTLKPAAPQALQFYSSLLYKSCSPTTQTFVAIMNSCITSGHWQEALRLSVSLIDEDYQALKEQQQQQRDLSSRREDQQFDNNNNIDIDNDNIPSSSSSLLTVSASNAHPLIFTAALQALGKDEKNNNKHWVTALKFANYLIQKQQQMISDAEEKKEIKKRKNPSLRRAEELMMKNDDDDENNIDNDDDDGDSSNDDSSSESLFNIVDQENNKNGENEENQNNNINNNNQSTTTNKEERESSETQPSSSSPINHLSWIDDAFLVELLKRLGAAGKWMEAIATFNKFVPDLVSAVTVEAVSSSVMIASHNDTKNNINVKTKSNDKNGEEEDGGEKQKVILEIDKKLQELWAKKRM